VKNGNASPVKITTEESGQNQYCQRFHIEYENQNFPGHPTMVRGDCQRVVDMPSSRMHAKTGRDHGEYYFQALAT
jgi:hypothetical protein